MSKNHGLSLGASAVNEVTRHWCVLLGQIGQWSTSLMTASLSIQQEKEKLAAVLRKLDWLAQKIKQSNTRRDVSLSQKDLEAFLSTLTTVLSQTKLTEPDVLQEIAARLASYLKDFGIKDKHLAHGLASDGAQYYLNRFGAAPAGYGSALKALTQMGQQFGLSSRVICFEYVKRVMLPLQFKTVTAAELDQLGNDLMSAAANKEQQKLIKQALTYRFSLYALNHLVEPPRLAEGLSQFRWTGAQIENLCYAFMAAATSFN